MPDINPPTPPQFYALEEPLVEKKAWWQEKKLLLFVGSGVAVIVVVVLVAILVSNFIANSKARSAQQAATDKAADIVATESSTCATDDTACLNRVRADAALATGAVDACTGLEGEEYDNCVALIAADQMKAELCDALEGESRTTCVDNANSLYAQAQNDFILCAKVIDEIAKLACEANITDSATRVGKCAEYHVSQTECDQQAALLTVINLGDPAGCNSFVGASKDNCLNIFSSYDEDLDGLTLQEEFGYGTSPTEADTDKDGYTDGEEVASGHDPLK